MSNLSTVIIAKSLNIMLTRFNSKRFTELFGTEVMVFLSSAIVLFSMKNEVFSLYDTFYSFSYNSFNTVSMSFSPKILRRFKYNESTDSDISTEEKLFTIRYESLVSFIQKIKMEDTDAKNFTELDSTNAGPKNIFSNNEVSIICKERGIYCVINNSTIKLFKYFNVLNSLSRSNALKCIDAFVNECSKNYSDNRDSKLEGRQVIFEKMVKASICDNKYKITDFSSNKHFDQNIFLEDKDRITKYIDQFIVGKENVEATERYKKFGYTKKATILLTGKPGTGKTSIIKGIINRTGRHVVNVNFGTLKTADDFTSIFRNTTYNGIEVPISKICFIFEDVDAFTNSNILFNRESVDDVINGIKNRSSVKSIVNSIAKEKEKAKMESADKLTLSLAHILNVLDGIVELKDTMIIFTTNHAEKLDPAFTRPGRMDFRIDLKYPSKSIIFDIIKYSFSVDSLDSFKNLDLIVEDVVSAAVIQEACFTNFDVQSAIDFVLESIDKQLNNEKEEQDEAIKNAKDEQIKKEISKDDKKKTSKDEESDEKM